LLALSQFTMISSIGVFQLSDKKMFAQTILRKGYRGSPLTI